VYSGVYVLDAGTGITASFCDVTKVYFNDYSQEEILRYVRQEQPFDKSGSYAIQSSWSRNVARAEGDIENVMGLPWSRLAPVLSKLGVC
jgi:septum formation protein